AASYALLSTSPAVLGTSAHATHFVVVPALTGFLLLVDDAARLRLSIAFLAALSFGVAFLMKQQGIYFVVFAWLLFASIEWRHSAAGRARVVFRLVLFAVGLAVPFAVTCLLLWQAGVWNSFWFWTFTYARQYVSMVPWAVGWKNLKTTLPTVIGPSVWIWVL